MRRRRREAGVEHSAGDVASRGEPSACHTSPHIRRNHCFWVRRKGRRHRCPRQGKSNRRRRGFWHPPDGQPVIRRGLLPVDAEGSHPLRIDP